MIMVCKSSLDKYSVSYKICNQAKPAKTNQNHLQPAKTSWTSYQIFKKGHSLTGLFIAFI